MITDKPTIRTMEALVEYLELHGDAIAIKPIGETKLKKYNIVGTMVEMNRMYYEKQKDGTTINKIDKYQAQKLTYVK